MTLTHRTTSVDGLNVFYREAGDATAPTVLLLHGFPTSSHMYRELIPALADRYHVIAPDLPGFGFTDAPDRAGFKYTFEHLTDVIERFTETLGLSHYTLFVFDYGAPVGFRLALRHPERIAAVISQNGNAYLEGLSEGWNPIGLESDPGLLEGSFRAKPRRFARLPETRNHPVAVHTRRAEP